MRRDSITKKQLDDLKKLGWHNVRIDIVTLFNVKSPAYITSVNVDMAIDFLRKKFGIIIYNAAAPYVDPREKGVIQYGYRVKFCNKQAGWNFREYIGDPQWSKNIYAAKRKALTIAIRYAFAIYDRKAKIVKIHKRQRNGCNKKG